MSNDVRNAIRATLDALKAQSANGAISPTERLLTENAIKAAERVIGDGVAVRRPR